MYHTKSNGHAAHLSDEDISLCTEWIPTPIYKSSLCCWPVLRLGLITILKTYWNNGWFQSRLTLEALQHWETKYNRPYYWGGMWDGTSFLHYCVWKKELNFDSYDYDALTSYLIHYETDNMVIKLVTAIILHHSFTKYPPHRMYERQCHLWPTVLFKIEKNSNLCGCSTAS